MEETVEPVVSVDVPPGQVAGAIKPLPKHPAPLIVHVAYLIAVGFAIARIYVYAVDDLPNIIVPILFLIGIAVQSSDELCLVNFTTCPLAFKEMLLN